MPSSYPAAPDDLTPGNTGLDHGDVSDAVAAVQATLGVNPQGAAATVAARLATGPVFGVNLDIPDQGFTEPDPPAAGYTRLTATTMEGEGQPPYLVVSNSEGLNTQILGEDDLNLYLLGSFLTGHPNGTIFVKGPDNEWPQVLEPGTDGQVLTADSSADVGLVWADPA